MKCVSVMLLCEFTVCFRRLEKGAFVWQGAKRHDSCLKVLLGLESISDGEINKQKLPEVH